MERLTDRFDGEAILICENETCKIYGDGMCSAASPCNTEQDMIDRLAAYEDAEEQGLLVRLIAPNGCAFCRGVRIMAGNFEGSFPLDEEHIEVIQTDDTTDFCFCPMCGRPLVSREEAEAAIADMREADDG